MIRGVEGTRYDIDDYEELLIRAWSCLSKSQKVEDPVLRRRVVDLAYRRQVLAETAILDQLHEQGMDPKKPAQSH